VWLENWLYNRIAEKRAKELTEAVQENYKPTFITCECGETLQVYDGTYEIIDNHICPLSREDK